MRNSNAQFYLYFDDGLVQYWRLIRSADAENRYRLTVQPSGISLDVVGVSWTGRKCWQLLIGNIETLEDGFAIYEEVACRSSSGYLICSRQVC